MARRRSTILAEQPAAIDIVSRIQRVESELSPAERRVADVVCRDYEGATRTTIADLASKAGVSQPTVTRFCRSVGCPSFAQFKIRLATTLTVAAVYLRSDRVFSDGHQQRMSAATLQPGNAVFAISNSGRSKPVIEAVEIARSFGAATVALTRPGTPLAQAAQIVIPMTIAEGENVLVPTPSRYAH